MYTMDIYKNLEKQTAIATVQVVLGSPESIPKELYQQFNFRKHNKLDGDNNVTIVDMQVPVWWTRPLNEETDSAITLNSNGYYESTN